MVCYLAFASKKWDSIQLLRSFIKCHQDNIMAPVSNTHILDFFASIITRKQNRRVRVLVIRIPLYFPFFPILLCFCFSVSAGCFCPEQVKMPSVWQEVVLLWLAHENTGDTHRSWDQEAREPPESGGPPRPRRGRWHPAEGPPHRGVSPLGGLHLLLQTWGADALTTVSE